MRLARTQATISPGKQTEHTAQQVVARRTLVTPWTVGVAFAILLMLVCYAIALNAYWVGDDYNYVRPKDLGVVLHFFDPVGRAVYRPLNWSIWAADYWLFGVDPLGWRLTRLAIHSLDIVWVALLAREITGRRDVSVLTAALFAVHPSQTETVTWAGGQADISFAVAYLPALWLFVRWRRGGPTWNWWLAGLLGFICMLGKEAAVTLPIAALWIDLIFGRDWLRWPGRRDAGWGRDWRLITRLLRDHSLFIAASGLTVGMRLYLFLTEQGRLMYGVTEQLGFLSRGLDVVTGYVLLAMGFWWVTPDVPVWPLLPKLLIIGGALAAIVGLMRWLGRVALFAVGWCAITLLLTLQAVANRWFYLPAFGVALLVASIWVRLIDAYRSDSRPWQLALASLPAIALVWLSIVTAVNNELWRESGGQARGILAQIRALHPDPPRPTTFYMAHPPYSDKGVLLFNSGFAASVYVLYNDWTGITSYSLEEQTAEVQAALNDPAKVGPNPIFLRYETGRVVGYPSLQALVDANK
jgi:hypothetical protein